MFTFTSKSRMLSATRNLCLSSLIIFASCGSPEQSSNEASLNDYSDFTLEQKLEDYAWLVGHIEEHYAMLEYKETHFEFNWQEAKAKFKEKISQEGLSREDFGAYMQELVAYLRDAHASATVMRSTMHDGYKSKLSTLGFAVERVEFKGLSLALVTKVYESILGDNAPVKVGDLILKIDGKDISTIIQEDILPYNDLGRLDSNLTFAVSRLATRQKNKFSKVPKGPVTVQLRRGSEKFNVDLNWVETSLSGLSKQNVAGPASVSFQIIEEQEDGEFLIKENTSESYTSHGWSPVSSVPPSLYGELFVQDEVLLQNQLGLSVIGHDYPLVGEAFPSIGEDYPYVFQEIELGDFKFKLINTAKGLTAIYRVEDFVKSRMACRVLELGHSLKYKLCRMLKGEDYAEAFNKLRMIGVNRLVLDMRSNGGGMLKAGYEMLRAFSKDSLEINKVRLRLNEEWLGKFKALSESSKLDLRSREAYKRQLTILEADVKAKKKLSSKISLMGHDSITGTRQAWEGESIVLVDEMCASMCDIFATLIQDHKLATVVGRNSMGAGGNVLSFASSPHTKISMSLTASIMYRLDGSVIENMGVKPDLELKNRRGKAYWQELFTALNQEKPET